MELSQAILLLLLVLISGLGVLVLLMLRAVAVARLDEENYRKWLCTILGDINNKVHLHERRLDAMLQ